MASLLDQPNTKLLKILAYGNPGTGKTCFAAGFPTPILYMDFDNKVSSAARFYGKDPERLRQIEVKNFSPTLHKDPMPEFKAEIEKLAEQQAKGCYEYKTLVIDSMTTFSTAMLRWVIRSNPGIKGRVTAQGTMPDIAHYGILKQKLCEFIPGLLTLDMHVVMLGHLAVYKSDATGELIREVKMDGSFSEDLPIYFDEVYYSYKGEKGEFLAQTQADHKFKCRSQIPGLPAVVPFSYREMESRF